MELKINIEDYLSELEIKEIAKEELRCSFKDLFRKEADIERILSNISHEFVFDLINSQCDCDLEQILKDTIKNTLQNKDISFYLFRRKDAWNRSESPMIKIIDEEVINSRPLIKEMIEKHIEKYPFNELDKNEIVDTISEVIKERLFGDK